ncbi:nickel-responsive transcriptional regulator NikR [candidate division KSB1 bacterium]|nr:nickel-responsive transcriptional regulator NikR [candidate division KSB1 bacterium]
MSKLVRFGISLDAQLLKEFDALIKKKEYANRSEAIRDLIRDVLIHKEWQDEEREMIGTITLIYDHHIRDLSAKLTHGQHQHHHQIISTMHVHLDHDNCLEVLAVRGKANEVRKIADHLIGMKGVKHGKLVTTSTGKDLH